MEERNTNNLISYETPMEARYYQVSVEEALGMNIIDLFQDEDNSGHKLISRADIILIYTLYSGGMEEFLEDYKKYVRQMVTERGYKFVRKPHYYLKNLLG